MEKIRWNWVFSAIFAATIPGAAAYWLLAISYGVGDTFIEIGVSAALSIACLLLVLGRMYLNDGRVSFVQIEDIERDPDSLESDPRNRL